MSALLASPTAHRTQTADAVEVVRRARRGPARHHRLLLAGLSVAVAGAFVVRVLLGDYTVTVPDLVRIVGGALRPTS